MAKSPKLLLLQLDLVYGYGVAFERSGDRDFNVFVFLQVRNELLGLLIARVIKFDDFLVVGEHAVTGFYAICHLQAVFAVFGAKIWLAALFFGAGAVYQIALDRGIGSKRAYRHGRQQNQCKFLHEFLSIR